MITDSRRAIEALRAGVPNRAAIRRMGIGREGIAEAFAARMSDPFGADPAPPGAPVLAGGFGSGKSHVLGYLREMALQENFVVSLVAISKETPLFDPAKLYADAVRGADVPGQNDDAIGVSVARAVRGTDSGRWDRFKEWVDAMVARWRAGDPGGLSPYFGAIVHLIERSDPEITADVVAFLGGGTLKSGKIKAQLGGARAAKRFDLGRIRQADLAAQRVRFLPRLFVAAGYAGWCVLLDEVELIGRYSALKRGAAYAEIGRWLGLDPAVSVPGIVSACAVSDDFADVVIDGRNDARRIQEILGAQGMLEQARLARLGMAALDKSGSVFVRQPDEAGLQRILQHVCALYREAYDWDPPAIDVGERLSGKSMRIYIKTWITLWDMKRLYGDDVTIRIRPMEIEYREAGEFDQAPPAASDAEEN